MSTMDLNAFLDGLDRYGPEIADWPEEQREAAKRLIRQSTEAARHQAQASLLESMLGELPSVQATPQLHARIMASRPGPAGQKLADWFSAALWRPALAAAVPLAFGFLLGVLQPAGSELDTDQYLVDELSMLAFSNSFEDPPYEN